MNLNRTDPDEPSRELSNSKPMHLGRRQKLCVVEGHRPAGERQSPLLLFPGRYALASVLNSAGACKAYHISM